MTIPALELRGVSRSYGVPGGREPVFDALKPVDLAVPDGAFTTIVGPSGAGKSTLLGLMGLLDVPTSGELSLLGETLGPNDAGLRRRMRAKHLGFVFQAFHLMPHRTVLENTMLGGLYRGMPRGARRAEALGALDRVGLTPKADKRASTLSGGERQRSAIARALVGSPRILLCDEPTGNLDTSNSQAVITLLQELSDGGITLVIVTHEPTIAALGTQQLQVVDGVLSEAVPVA